MNLTDGDAQLMKGRDAILPGYNAQAVVSPLDPVRAEKTGLFITAADVAMTPDDYQQLVPMLEQAEEMTGERAEVTFWWTAAITQGRTCRPARTEARPSSCRRGNGRP